MDKENGVNLGFSIKKPLNQRPKISKIDIYHAMKDQGYAKTTIHRTIKRMQAGGSFMDKPRTGQPKAILSPIKAKIVRAVKNKLGMGRSVARLFNCFKRSVVRT